MLNVCLTAIAAVLLISHPALGMDFQAPADHAASLATWLPQRPGARFQSGKAVRFYATQATCDYQCEVNPCKISCTGALMKAFDITAHEDANGRFEVFAGNGWTVTAPQSAPGPLGDFWLEEFARSLDFFVQPTGTIELGWATPGVGQVVDENGNESQIPVVTVVLNYLQSSKSPGDSLYLVLASEKRGVEQLLYFGDADPRDYYLKQRGYISRPFSSTKHKPLEPAK